MKNLKMEQIAAGNYWYPLYPFTYFLDDCVKTGVKNIEIWAAGPHFYLDDYTEAMVKDLGREIQARDLKAICLTPEQCMYPVNIGAEEDYIRERSVAYFEKAIRYAALLDIPNVLVTPGEGYRNKPLQAPYQRTVESLRRLCETAGEYGVHLFLEHLTVTSTNVAVYARELQRLKEDVGSDRIGCMVDTDMMSRYNETVEDYFRETRDGIEHVHFIDGMPGGHLVPGDGALAMESYLKTLNEKNYQGYMTLEIMNDRYFLNPTRALERALDWFRKYME